MMILEITHCDLKNETEKIIGPTLYIKALFK